MNLEQEPLCHKFQAVRRWTARRLGSLEHERRVCSIAATLFDLTACLHGLGAWDRRILRIGAVLHDVGRMVRDDGHELEGARMVLDDEALPLSAAERRAAAYLTRYHRGPVPDSGCDDILQRDDNMDRLRAALAFLRAADALDCRSLPSPQLVFALAGGERDRRLLVTCYLDDDSPKARRVYRRRKKHRLLEELLDCQVDIHIAHAQALRLVA